MFSIFKKDEKKSEGSLLDRLKQSVSKTRSQIVAKVEDLVSGEKKIDPELLTKLENVLLAADIGPRTTHQILEAVRQKLDRHALATVTDLKAELRNQLLHVLRTLPSQNGASSLTQESRPHVIFVVGVNGTGKTTTIGKLAHRLRQDGRSVVLAAGDTFRAAAIEQLGCDRATRRVGFANRRRNYQDEIGRRPCGSRLRRADFRAGAKCRHRYRGHGRTLAHEIKPDGRAR
jgi:fused signal recognition particle receptor